MIDGRKFDDIINRLKYINEHRQKALKLIIVGDPPIDSESGYFFNA